MCATLCDACRCYFFVDYICSLFGLCCSFFFPCFFVCVISHVLCVLFVVRGLSFVGCCWLIIVCRLLFPGDACSSLFGA